MLVGLDDCEPRFRAIIELYQRVATKSKKSNSDSHSKMLLESLSQEEKESIWDDGNLIFNFLYDLNASLDDSSKIIQICDQAVASIRPLF